MKERQEKVQSGEIEQPITITIFDRSRSDEIIPEIVPLFDVIKDPLDSWVDSQAKIEQINSTYRNPQDGVFAQMANKMVEITDQIRSRRGKPIKPPERKRLYRRFMDGFVESIIKGENSLEIMRFRDAASKLTKQEQDKIVEKAEESIAMIRDYKQQVAPHKENSRVQRSEISGGLQNWLQEDFDNIRKLSEIDFTRYEYVSLLKFLQENNSIVVAATNIAKNKESENPSRARLIEMFTQLADDYYEEGKNEHIWPLIEMSLPYPKDQIKTMIQSKSAQACEVVFGQLTDIIIENGKELPPQIKERLSIYLKDIASDAIQTLLRKAQMTKKSTFKTFKSDSLDVNALIMTDDPKTEQDTKPQIIQTSEENQQKIKKKILVDSTLHTEPSQISQSVRSLFDSRIKGAYTEAQLESLSKALAVIANMDDTGPKVVNKKLRSMGEVKLSDGSTQPAFSLRLTYKNSPRIIYVHHNNTVVLVDVIRHESNTYSRIRKHGEFPIVDVSKITDQD